MTMRFWLRDLFTRRRAGTFRKAPRSFRPTLELLEDRLTPSGTVTNLNDSGAGSLRDALNGGGVVDFQSGLSGTIVLSSTLSINTNVTITGPGSANLAVSGNNSVQDFTVASGVTASISNLTVENGSAGLGGGIFNNGTLTLTNSTISGNSATTGGGIFNSGTLTLSNANISGNSAYSNGGGIFNYGTVFLSNSELDNNSVYGAGAGISNYYGTMTLIDTNLSGNSSSHNVGGGIENVQGSMSLNNCDLSGNTAQSGGGIENGGMMTLSNATTVEGNSAVEGGGGILNKFGTLTLNNSTVSDNSISGNVSPNSGGISNLATLIINYSTISGNSATYAGGIGNAGGTLTISNSTVSDNSALAYGGGIENNGMATVSNCTVSGNTAYGAGGIIDEGGGIDNAGGTLTVTNTTFSSNKSEDGGGLFNYDGASLSVSSSTLSANTLGTGYGGGIYNEGTLTVSSTNLFGNSGGVLGGGGIFNDGSASLSNSTLSSNVANTGGGICNQTDGTLMVSNVTLAGNTATFPEDGGGGINNFGSVALIDSTLSGNSAHSGGGILNSGTMTLSNTLVAGNSAPTGPDVYGTFTSDGYNLIGEIDGSSGFGVSDLTGTIAMPLNPQLGPLANNGGATQTLALLAGSPAIGTGDPSQAGTIAQNGVTRPATPDIGAFQTVSPLVVTTTADSGPGSLRAAIIYADANNGGTITFDIPGNGVQTINVGSALPAITTAVTIDGYSQPGASPNTLSDGDNATLNIVLDGSFAGSSAIGLTLAGSQDTVEGLVVNQFGGGGIWAHGGSVIQGTFVGTDVSGTMALGNNGAGVALTGTDNTVGGLLPADRNVISGNISAGSLYGAYGFVAYGSAGVYDNGGDNLIEGNFIGTDVTGEVAVPNYEGVELENSYGSSTIGGSTAGAGNLISGNTDSGIFAENAGDVIQGNQIGTDVAGMAALGNGNGIFGTSNLMIGGATAAAGNLISGNGYGVYLEGNEAIGVNDQIENNRIGTDANGNADLGNADGVVVEFNVTGGLISSNAIEGNGVGIVLYVGASENSITDNTVNHNGYGIIVGGASNNSITGNTLAYNSYAAVSLFGPFIGYTAVGNTISQNAIYGDGGDLSGLTIDLNLGTSYANNSQGAPSLTSATTFSSTTTVAGMLASTSDSTFLPNTSYTLEFFATPAEDTDGVNSGEFYLGSETVTTGASGSATFVATGLAGTSAGEIVTATATNQTTGDTSQFSAGTISKLSSTTTVADAGGTYDGTTAFVATVSVTGGGTITGSASLDYYDNTTSTDLGGTAPTNAGTYTVTATYAGDANHTGSSGSTNFTIDQANATVVYSGYTGGTYDGSQHTQTVAVTGVGNDGTLYSTSLSGTNAGSYSQAWSFSNANYNSAGESGTLAFSIGKASSTTTVSIGTGPFTYTGSAQTPATVTVTGAGGLSLTPTASYQNNINAGTATASYSYAGDANHTGSSASTNFTIGQAAATVVYSGYVGGTYDGNQHTQTVTVTGVGNLTLYTTSVSGTNAGSYSQAWSFSNANYISAGESGTLSFTISQASSTTTVADAGGTYNGSAFLASGTVTGAGGLSTTPTSFSYVGTGGTTYGPTSVAPTNAGAYTVTASYSGDANHTGSSSNALAFTISQASSITPGSIYVLDPTAGGALTLSGNAEINVSSNVVVDSSSSSALSASGNAQVQASTIHVYGGVQRSGNATFSPAPVTGVARLADPLAGLTAPTYSGTPNSETLSGNSTATISAGVYSQITVSGNARLTLNAGIYVIEGGGFSVSGNGSVSGTGVMIYNTKNSAGTFGAIIIAGNGTVSLTPSSTGTYAGILIFQDRANSHPLTLSGNAMQGITGTIYAATAQFVESGNAQVGSTNNSISLVVDTLTISGNAVANTLDAPPSGTVAFTPAQIRTAYGINNLTLDGTGQTIAIVDAYDDPSIYAAVDAFDTQFGLTSSGPTLFDQYGTASTFLTVLNQNGQATSLPTTDPSGAGADNWEVEEALDVEWTHAIAPGAQVVLVEANSQSLSDLMSSVATAASQPGVSVVSMSWGFTEGQAVFQSDEAMYDSYFTTPGVTFVASTGDYGTADPEYPAFSPNVLAVGGTSLNLNADNSYASESGWGGNDSTIGAFVGSGGGLSQFESEPAYQLGVQSTGSRTTPDVSFVADPSTGAWVADPYNLDPSNPFEVVGGTSLSAPAWAGLVALTNQGRAATGDPNLNQSSPTETQSDLYSLSQADYNVISSGTNGGYNAAAGYNLVTGLGTPVANQLVPDLVNGNFPATGQVAPISATLNANPDFSASNADGTTNVINVFCALTMSSRQQPDSQQAADRTVATAPLAVPPANPGILAVAPAVAVPARAAVPTSIPLGQEPNFTVGEGTGTTATGNSSADGVNDLTLANSGQATDVLSYSGTLGFNSNTARVDDSDNFPFSSSYLQADGSTSCLAGFDYNADGQVNNSDSLSVCYLNAWSGFTPTI